MAAGTRRARQSSPSRTSSRSVVYSQAGLPSWMTHDQASWVETTPGSRGDSSVVRVTVGRSAPMPE